MTSPGLTHSLLGLILRVEYMHPSGSTRRASSTSNSFFVLTTVLTTSAF